MNVSGQDLWQEEVFLLIGAIGHDRWANGVDGEHGHWSAGAHGLIKEDELLEGRAPLAAVLLGPANTEPAVGGHLLDDATHRGANAMALGEFFLDLRGQQLRVIVTQLRP